MGVAPTRATQTAGRKKGVGGRDNGIARPDPERHKNGEERVRAGRNPMACFAPQYCARERSNSSTLGRE
jgi:hypothetical protein